MTIVKELKYSSANTYLIKGTRGNVLFDAGWAGSFPQLCKALGSADERLQDIRFLIISHFHPDHMGIAQDIAEHGVVIVAADVQKDLMHSADKVFIKENNASFKPIVDDDVRFIAIGGSRELLKEAGLDGELVHTPGHSDDSISLCLDDGQFFVGDLDPLYESDAHKGTQVGKSWELLLSREPKIIYYGHAKTAVLSSQTRESPRAANTDLYGLIVRVMDYIGRNYSVDRIVKKTGADRQLTERIIRMCMTHPHVGADGILDRIENTSRQHY